MSNAKDENMQKKRGATQKNNINNLKSKGVKKNLEYNDKGQPIGDNYGEMQSYIGVRTRKTVSLNAGDWRRVSITLKNKIWEDVSGAFNIDEGMKKKVLRDAGRMMKDFKSKMTSNYIYPMAEAGMIEQLSVTPCKYPELDHADWIKFVKHRLSPEFQALRKVQCKRALQNQSWHRTSRRGMHNVREDLKKELGVDHVERCEVWIRSREKKKSMVTDLDGQIKERINELKEKVSSGEVVVKGRDDILTLALGTPEHPGRVRAAGSSATISSWFGRKKRQPVAKYISEMDAEIERLKAEIDALKRETKQADQLQNMKDEYNDEDQGPLLKKPRLETSASKGRGKQKCSGERCSAIASDGAAIDLTHQDTPPRTTKSKARKPHKTLTHTKH
ncbi:hypothetical protein CsatB_022337 [Cannabis sativa]